MKNILDFSKFNKIDENYEEDPEYQIKKFFNELTKNIHKWFDDGSFSGEDIMLYDIKINTTNNTDKYLTFDFQDSNFYYLVEIIITLKEVGEDSLQDCFVKIKRYGLENSTLLTEVDKNVIVDELDDEKIAEMIAEMDDEKKKSSYSDDIF